MFSFIGEQAQNISCQIMSEVYNSAINSFWLCIGGGQAWRT